MATCATVRIADKAVLVVEDQGLIALDLQRRLENFGYSVPAVAKSAEEAVRLNAIHRPDLILMDIHLNGSRDGIDAAAEIRKKSDVPIIFLTAHADPATVERAKKVEPAGYMVKPFRAVDIRVQIEIAFHKYQVERKHKNEAWYSNTLRDSILRGTCE